MTNSDKDLIEINKLRKSLGLRPVIIKKGKCLKCGIEILIMHNYRCRQCNYLINKLNLKEEVFERDRMFNASRSNYILGEI